MQLSEKDKEILILDIATRAGTAKQIASWYDCTVAELRAFVAAHQAEIEDAAKPPGSPIREPTPEELGDLWITNKFERLKRLQAVADAAYRGMVEGTVAIDAVALREFRSYLALAANELGQLLHRGSGEHADGEVLEVVMKGIDTEQLR